MNNKKLLKNISFFTFFNVVNSAIPFLLLPVLTTYLSPEDYGIIDIFLNISLIATPIIGLSIVQSISRFYFEDIDLPKFITTVFTLLLLIGSVVVALGSLIAWVAKDFLNDYGFPPFVILFALGYTILSQISEVLLILWRVSYKTIKFGLFRIVKTVFDLGLSVVLIVNYGMGWEGRLFPQLGVALFFAIAACIFLVKNEFLLRPKIHKHYKKEALSFSLPLVFHTLGGHVIGFSDRFFILFMLGLSNVGIYSVGYQVGMVVALLQTSFNQAWVPFFFEKLKENKNREKLRLVKITYAYFVLMLVLATVFYFLTPLIFRYFIGESFENGAGVVGWVLMGYAFQGMYKMVVNYLFYLKKTKLIAICTFFTVVVNIALNYFLIGMNGIDGAAQATLISFVVLFTIVFLISAQNFKMPWLFFLKSR